MPKQSARATEPPVKIIPNSALLFSFKTLDISEGRTQIKEPVYIKSLVPLFEIRGNVCLGKTGVRRVKAGPHLSRKRRV